MLVLSVSFSPALAELGHDVKDSEIEDRTMNMVSALVMAVKAFKKNMAKEVAEMSGGEYTTFVGDKRFEARVLGAARDARNRYLITFSPSDPTPGLHTIRVRTAQDYGARIVARANYWLDAQQGSGSDQGHLGRGRCARRVGARMSLQRDSSCCAGFLTGCVHGNLTVDTEEWT